MAQTPHLFTASGNDNRGCSLVILYHDKEQSLFMSPMSPEEQRRRWRRLTSATSIGDL